MERIELTAERRAVSGKQVKQLRRQGLVPAIVYGSAIDPVAVQISNHDLSNVLRQAGTNRLIDLKVDGDSHITLVRDIQRDVLRQDLLHVDFQAVVMTETITTDVPIVLAGKSPVVERGEGLINQVLQTVQIEALPADLLSSIPVNISGLVRIDNAIYVKDLMVPGTVTILNDPEEIVVRISTAIMPAEEVEEEPLAVEEVEVEIIGRRGAAGREEDDRE